MTNSSGREFAAVSVVFQPIVEVGGSDPKLHAIEALSRGPAGSRLESAEALFAFMRRLRQEAAIDHLCVRTALAEARHLSDLSNLCLNVHSVTLAEDPAFVEYLLEEAMKRDFLPSQLTIEVLEDGLHNRDRTLYRSLERLQEAGARIAIDDLGTGGSNLETLLECRPDYLKVSRHFVRGCDGDPVRRGMLGNMADLARTLGARLIAEGVEEASELETVQSLGIDLVQGYLFSRPLPCAALETSFLVQYPAGWVRTGEGV
jgi:EAL domain-containing protein (putative c-di-GMP-specific phosphodiesterase class I)